jgi:hypothetical protein
MVGVDPRSGFPSVEIRRRVRLVPTGSARALLTTLEAEGAMSSISQPLELLDLLLGHCEKWKVYG